MKKVLAMLLLLAVLTPVVVANAAVTHYSYPPMLQVTAKDTQSGVKSLEVKVDTQTPTVASVPTTAAEMTSTMFWFSTVGTHTVNARATDASGNVSAWITETVVIDSLINPTNNWATKVWGASKEDSAHPAAVTIDSNPSTYWQLSKPSYPETLEVSLAETAPVLWIDHINGASYGAWWVDIWATADGTKWYPIERFQLSSTTPIFQRLYTKTFLAKRIRLVYHRFSNSTVGRISDIVVYCNKDYAPVPYAKAYTDMSGVSSASSVAKGTKVQFRSELWVRNTVTAKRIEVYDAVVYLERLRTDGTWGRVARAYYNSVTGRYECTYAVPATYTYRFAFGGSSTLYSTKTSTFKVTMQ